MCFGVSPYMRSLMILRLNEMPDPAVILTLNAV